MKEQIAFVKNWFRIDYFHSIRVLSGDVEEAIAVVWRGDVCWMLAAMW